MTILAAALFALVLGNLLATFFYTVSHSLPKGHYFLYERIRQNQEKVKRLL
jgi:hypothetical protein